MSGRHRYSWRQKAEYQVLTMAAGAFSGIVRHSATAGITYAGHEIGGPGGAALGIALGTIGNVAGLQARRSIAALRDRRRPAAPTTEYAQSTVRQRRAYLYITNRDTLKALNSQWQVPDTLVLAEPIAENAREVIDTLLDPEQARWGRTGQHTRAFDATRNRSELAERARRLSARVTAEPGMGIDPAVARSGTSPGGLLDRARRAIRRAGGSGQREQGRGGGREPQRPPERSRERDGPTLER